MSTGPTVANRHHFKKGETWPPGCIYVGRPTDIGRSVLQEQPHAANGFVLGNNAGDLDQYKAWLWGQMQEGGAVEAGLAAIHEHSRLVCSCAPGPCHAEVIKSAWHYRRQSLWKPGPGDEVTALSLWEPWASLMATGAKRIETRDWSMKYRGWLLICAAARRVKRELNEYLDDDVFQLGLGGMPLLPVGIDDLAFGHAVALVRAVDVVPTQELAARITGHMVPGISLDEMYFGDFTPGRFGFVTTDLIRLKPFPVKGAQGLFKVRLPDDLALCPREAPP